MDNFDTRELVGYAEDFDDIDPNYPTMDELDNMDSFLSHFEGFKHKVSDEFSLTDTIVLYAVYINTTRD